MIGIVSNYVFHCGSVTISKYGIDMVLKNKYRHALIILI